MVFSFVYSADRGDEGFVSLNESRVTVSHDGHVRWIVPLIVHSACAVDVTYFPFDEQRCFVRFGSWIYDEKQVNLSLKATAVRLDSYSVNSELSLLEVITLTHYLIVLYSYLYKHLYKME